MRSIAGSARKAESLARVSLPPNGVPGRFRYRRPRCLPKQERSGLRVRLDGQGTVASMRVGGS